MVILDACRSSPFRMASADGRSRAIGRGEIAGEAAWVLDDHNAHAVALDAVEQRRKARPALDRV
jgi:hypothetical protein